MESTVRYFVYRYPFLVFLRGGVAWEVQIGPFILMWVYPHYRQHPFARGRRLLVSFDEFWWLGVRYAVRRRFRKMRVALHLGN